MSETYSSYLKEIRKINEESFIGGMSKKPHRENCIQTMADYASAGINIDEEFLSHTRELLIKKCADVIIYWINFIYLPLYCNGQICNSGKHEIINTSFDHIWGRLQEAGFSEVYSAVRNAIKGPCEEENFYASCIVVDELCENPEEGKFDVKLYIFNNYKYYDIFCTHCNILYINDNSDSE